MHRNYTYAAFGKLAGRSGETENSYKFAGEQFDANLGDYYLRQRYCDTETGRFTRRDSYEGSQVEPLTLHKYLYAGANPINFADPTGLFTLADTNAANAIRNTLAGIQVDSGNYLLSASESGGDYGAKNFLGDLAANGAVAAAVGLFPILGLFFTVSSFVGIGGGGGSDDRGYNPSSSSGSSSGFLFRGDSRSPEEIFANGFTAYNPSGDISDAALLRHVDNFDESSAFVATSKDIRAAMGFSTQGFSDSGWVYIIRSQSNGRDVNMILGRNSPEQEVAIPRRVDPLDIIAAKPIQDFRFKGRIRINSRFRR